MDNNQQTAHQPQHSGYPNNQTNNNGFNQGQTSQNFPQQNHTPAQQPQNNSVPKTPVVEKIEQLTIFVYFFIASILLFRFVLGLFGGNRTSPFVDFVFQLTQPFMLPFEGIFGKPSLSKYSLDFNILIALIVYALIFFGLSRLVRIIFK